MEEKKIEKVETNMSEDELEYVRGLAQLAMNLSVYFMPVSGLSMAGVGMVAKQSEKFLGEKLEPEREWVEEFVSYQSRLLAPYLNEKEELQNDISFLLGLIGDEKEFFKATETAKYDVETVEKFLKIKAKNKRAMDERHEPQKG